MKTLWKKKKKIYIYKYIKVPIIVNLGSTKTELFYEPKIYIVLGKDEENWIDICVLLLLNCFLFTQFEMKNPKSYHVGIMSIV